MMPSPYADVPAYPLVFPLIYGAIAYFALAMTRHLRVLALARPSNPIPAFPARLRGLLVYVFGQERLFKDPLPGLMHVAIFWGFMILAIGTADIATGGLIQVMLSWPLDGAVWVAVTALQNVFAVLVIAGVTYALWRRLVIKPARLTLSRGALLILGMIGALVLAELLALAFEAAIDGPIPGAFVSNAIAIPLESLPPATLDRGFAVSWWAHIGLVAAFLVYLPGSKHLHIATSFPNVWLRKLAPRAELPAMDFEREDLAFGVRTVADLGWKDLLDGFTCTECGRCQAACPAFATGKTLNPKELIMGLRHMTVAAEAGAPLIPRLWRDRGAGAEAVGPRSDGLAGAIIGNAIDYDAVWDCVTCGACVEACPVLIEHVDKIIGLRRNLVLEDARFPAELTTAFRNLENAGNPWGEPRAARMEWTKGLPFEVPTAASLAKDGRLDEIEVLYFVGCSAAFDERNRKVARAVATCLDAAGVHFAVLGEEEQCCGDPARRTGNEYLASLETGANEETLRRYGMERRTILTACPHCFTALSLDAGRLGPRFDVVHHSVYLRRLLAEGRLRVDDAAPTAGSPGSVTLHDSCYVARYAGVVQEPREVLRAIPGLEVREMERSGKQTFCCGGGGGRLWMEETRGTRINLERTREARATGAEAVVTECPFCIVMIRDGLSDTADGPGGVVAIDLAEVLAGRLRLAPAALDGAGHVPLPTAAVAPPPA
jgi:Fe-S oxidoreductase/nitrate reductase gamma subunit